jgi:predicted metal-binding protein
VEEALSKSTQDNKVGSASGECTPEGEMREYQDSSGRSVEYRYYSAVVPLTDFEYADRFKEMCGECPHHGKNFSCPPCSPSFASHVGAASTAIAICVRLSKAYFEGLSPQERYHVCFREAGRLLMAQLQDFREQGRVIAASGPCRTCEKCALESGGQECARPDVKTYSLESLGVNVVGLLKKAFDIDLEWDSKDELAQTVCAVGAAFFD